MTPGDLIRDLRTRHGLSQRELAYRAGTSQSAVARIEGGDEDITWKRLNSILAAMGDRPVLKSARLPHRYELGDLTRDRARPPEERLANGIEFNRFGSELAIAGARRRRRRRRERGRRMPPPERVFRLDEILRVLAQHGVDFVVIGGVAVQTHGYVRLTHDLDIVARPDILNFTRLSEALAELDGALRTPGALNIGDPQQLQRAPLIPVGTRAGPLDVVNVEHVAGAPASYAALRDAALVVELDGLSVAVAGLSDLIRMKRAAGREHDLMDIEALTRDAEST